MSFLIKFAKKITITIIIMMMMMMMMIIIINIVIVIIITITAVKYIWNNSYIWTAVVDQSEEWSSQ